MDKSNCPYPGCFFCLIRGVNPAKRRPTIAKFFKELPNQDDDGQVIPISGLWNNAMSEPSEAEFVDAGVFECMAALIWKGLTNKKWLEYDQNIYIPYYAAHIIGSYTMVVEEFAERAIAAGVVPALMELLRGRLTWIEQRVAVRALGHLATYDATFPSVAAYGEILDMAIHLSIDAPSLVYKHFYELVDKKKSYQCDLLTRGAGGVTMEAKNAENWASQLQCWSLQLINCFAFKEEFVGRICRRELLTKLTRMWGGLANENSPAGVGLLRTLCNHRLGRQAVSQCPRVIEGLCDVARSSDDWQAMAIDCLLCLLEDPSTRSQMLDRAMQTLMDLVEYPKDGRKLADILLQTFRDIESESTANTKALVDELKAREQQMNWEKKMPKKDVQIKLAAALVRKLEGNADFSAGEIQNAAAKYTQALAICPMKAKKERVILYSNRAQCYLLLQKPEEAVSDTTHALCIHNPINTHGKSLWRRAQAYECLGLAKESLLDAVMFVNELWQSEEEFEDDDDNDDDGHGHGNGNGSGNGRVPGYVEHLIRKQMQASWLFSEVAHNNDDGHDDGDDDGDGDGYGYGMVDANGDGEEEDGGSKWETASGSD